MAIRSVHPIPWYPLGLGSLFKQNCCCPNQGKKFTYIPRSVGTYLMSLCCSSVPGISNLEKSGPAQHIAVLLQHNVPTDSRCYRIHIYLLPCVYLLFYLGLRWVFTALCGFPLVMVPGFSLPWLLLWPSMGSELTGSVVESRRL